MTENELRNKYVSTAESYLGVEKYSARHHEIVGLYNSKKPLPRGYALQDKDDWCAGYASAMAVKAGIADIFPREVSCYYIVENAKKMGIWVENDAYTPKPGDCILYDWDDDGKGDCKGGADHVGIVRYVKDGYINVIEGNTQGSKVATRKIAVNGKYIRGFICPKFASLATEKESTKVTINNIELPTLRIGASGNEVKTVQRILRQLEYTGADGKLIKVDGEFGENTEFAVKKFQKNRGSSLRDGIVGIWTWTKLLKG